MADFILQDELWAGYPFYDARQWFVDKLKVYVPDAQMEGKLNQAKAIVEPRLAAGDLLFKQEWEMEQGALQRDWSTAVEEQLRAEIFYGLLGVYRVFFEPASRSYLHFIARRRYRTVVRMTRFVNPEAKRAFVFPHGASALDYKLNAASAPFWQKKAEKYPFVLTPAGIADPVSAVGKLFETYPEPYDPDPRNQVGCEAVAVIVHLDSLLAAKNPKKVLDSAIAEANNGNNYVRIDHPIGSTYYTVTGEPAVGGYATIAEDAPQAATRLRLEMDHFPQVPLSSIVQSFAGEYIVKTRAPSVRFRIADGSQPVMVGGQPDNIVDVTGLEVNRPFVVDDTTYTGWLEVQPLRRVARRGARLVGEEDPGLHFINDPRESKALFERRYVAKEDLLVGDHIQLQNHPLYERIVIGEWQAEHSFVTGVFRSREIETAGHGLSGTVKEIAQQFLDELNRHLGLLQAVIRMRLRGSDKQDGSFGDVLCLDAAERLVPCDSPRVSRRVDVTRYFPFEYRDGDDTLHMVRRIERTTGAATEYKLVPEPSPPVGPEDIVPAERAHFEAERTGQPALYVFQYRDELRQFWIPYEGRRTLLDSPAPNDPGDIWNWGVFYFDPRFVKPRIHFLYVDPGRRGGPDEPSWIQYADLQGQFPIYADARLGRIPVVRPRVDFSPAYQNYLKQIEAI